MTDRAAVIFRESQRPLAEPRDPRRRSPFEPNMLSKTMRTLRFEGAQLGAERVVVEVDGPVRQDGYPAVTKLRTPAIRAFIESRYGPLRYDVDSFLDWEDNVRALALALEALDRYGVTRHGEQYAGWKALPPGQVALGSGTNMSRDVALKVLAEESGVDVPEDASDAMLELITRKAKGLAHPDRNGGDRGRWNAVEEAVRALALEVD